MLILWSVFLVLVAFSSADPPAAKPSAATVREAVYFGPAGPVRIRLHLSVDGQPVEAVWADAVNGLFAHRDRDGNGVLDAAERTPFSPPARKGRDIDVFIEGQAPVQPLQLQFPTKDAEVNRTVFAEALKTAGRGPVTLRSVAAGAESRQLSAALFKHLDQNGDGKLSAAELKAARERLAALDLDEDEFVTTAELLGRGVGANGGRPAVFPGMRQPEAPAESTALLFLTAEGPQAVKQVLAARGGAKATALKPAEFGADPKAFAALDQDGNGALDTAELTAWLSGPPALELAVAFDPAGGRLRPVTAGVAVEKAGGTSVALPGGRFRFEPPAGPPVKEWKEAADALAARFKELAKESGSAERKQVENEPTASAFFDLADRNADGKVDAAEAEAALKASAPLAACRVDVAFADRGDGLFELLDRNEDGRLSPRELVESAAVLKPFAGPDGTVGPKDLVREFRVRVVVEPIPVGVLFAYTVPRPTGDAANAAAPPAWFTKADRNGDGDVSLREFVGPVELFRKFDRDGDGLIDAAEANATGK